jgi:PUA domain protein
LSKNPRRQFLREKKARRLLLEFSRKIGCATEKTFGAKPRIELVETQGAEFFFVDGKPLITRVNGILFPTLIFSKTLSFLSQIVVDMGAVPYVCNGADIMAPGVCKITGEFKENDLLLIIDERHGKPLAVGVALFDSQSMRKIEHGKIVKNIHYIGDKIWSFIKSQ